MTDSTTEKFKRGIKGYCETSIRLDVRDPATIDRKSEMFVQAFEHAAPEDKVAIATLVSGLPQQAIGTKCLTRAPFGGPEGADPQLLQDEADKVWLENPDWTIRRVHTRLDKHGVTALSYSRFAHLVKKPC